MKKILLSTVCTLGLSISSLSAASMSASFVNDEWNKAEVPEDMVCSDYNMDAGTTPEISLKNIPAGTKKVVLAFSDETFKGMRDGGHGIISYAVNKSNVIVPSIEGETFDLPEGFKSETKHRAGQYGKVPGAYLAPCSGGKGNTYSVLIKAMNGAKTLGQTSLTLGTY